MNMSMYASTLNYRPYQLIPFVQALIEVKIDLGKKKRNKVLYVDLKRSYSILDPIWRNKSVDYLDHIASILSSDMSNMVFALRIYSVQ